MEADHVGMNELAPSPALNASMGLAAMASLATLFGLAGRVLKRRPLLPQSPRRPVPWNGWPALLLLSPLLINLLALVGVIDADGSPSVPRWLAMSTIFAAPVGAPALGAGTAGVAGATLAPLAAAAPVFERADEFVLAALLMTLGQLAVACAVYVGLAALAGATRADLGLPENAHQLLDDLRLGGVAFLAALVPTYVLQASLNWLLKPQQGHPFLEQFAATPSLGVIAAIAAAAVIGAPVFEETAFRLVLQGWLEKRAVAAPPGIFGIEVVDDPPENEAAIAIAEQRPDSDWPGTESSAGSNASGGAVAGAAKGGVVSNHEVVDRVPWWPVAVSAVLFGLAHWGHGASPVSLVLLGLVLGYLYHRTHRIVPSITCHLLFNAFTMWLLLLEFLNS